jgi:uncharacterized protein (DUF1800 family)
MCFGATDKESIRISEIGMAGWIEEQLTHDPLPDLGLRWQLRNLDALDKEADELEGYKRARVIRQLRQGSLLRQVYSHRQLYEMMVEFWTDHLNISVEKGDCWFLKVVDDRDVIRPHALGNFRDLLHASASSPAMLVYLDNQANQKGAPNENYARELLELHTLGIDGGYTQEDIIDLARGLTGWTVKEHFWLGRFQFDEDLHDQGSKQVLDLQFGSNGAGEVAGILDHIATHPSTARHLAIKLVRRFICDDPENDAAELVEKTQRAFLASGGEIAATLRPILLDGLVRDSGLKRMKYKRPVDFIVSALRMSEAETNGGQPLHGYLARMGQALFAWPTPDGPPDIASHWQANLAPRWNFALRMATGGIEGTDVPVERWLDGDHDHSVQTALEKMSIDILGTPLPHIVIEELIRSIGKISDMSRENQIRAILAGLIASPSFQYR